METRLLRNLAEKTLLGTLPVLELTSDTDPFALVDVVGFFCSVKHQIVLFMLDVTKSCD